MTKETRAKFKCRDCGHEWTTEEWHGCPKCAAKLPRFSLEEVRPLVEALKNASRALADAVVFHNDEYGLAKVECNRALNHARKLGMMEEK